MIVRRALPLIGAAAVAVGVVLVTAAPAGANVVGPCTGTATINGVVYTPKNDTISNPVLVPTSGVARYQGSTQTLTAPEHGHLAVVVGPAEISVYDWASPNTSKRLTDNGQENLSRAYSKLPIHIVGIYELKGYQYNGTTLYCSGHVYVKFQGSPFSSPTGIVSVGGTAVAGLGVALAGFGRRLRR